MIDISYAYINYLSKFRFIIRPKMPKYDLTTYTDNEYKLAIRNVEKDFENIDEIYLTERYLKGE